MLANRVRVGSSRKGEVYLAQDSDFVNVNGNWIYRGAELEVEIPTHINGQLVTSTWGMFSGLPNLGATPVTKVVLKHSNVTNMEGMFNGSEATTLDLSSFNTSKVTSMAWMFSYFDGATLDLSGFNTSNVTNMEGMFRGSRATTLDLSSFNTSRVTSMVSMFYESNATILDLSSFVTYDDTYMNSMFQDSSARIGYARTQADANRFNRSSGKPTGLNFVVK